MVGRVRVGSFFKRSYISIRKVDHLICKICHLPRGMTWNAL